MTLMPYIMITAAVMFLIERLWPANALPKVPNWWPRVLLLNLVQAAVVWLAGVSWDQWMRPLALLSSHQLALWQQVLIGYLTITFVYYFWHRLRHESKFFWRLCHQLHHSPRRMEILMSFYKHPVEITINGILSSAIMFPLLGLSPQAAVLTSLATGIAELFYHWNIKTPRWFGYLFQRPESHRVHHQYLHHTQNYSDIPLWDMLFGTFKNPSKKVTQCGFDDWREDRFDDMLAGRDVHAAGSKQLSPMHLLPSCIGCSKRWACWQSRQLQQPDSNSNSSES